MADTPAPEPLLRHFAGIPVPERAYDALTDEFASAFDARMRPEELAQSRLDTYGRLLAELRCLLAHEAGTDNGLESLTDKSINKAICVILTDVCRLARHAG